MRDLSALGIDVPKSFSEGRLHVDDFYSATLSGGRLLSNVPNEPYEYGIRHSLSVADFSIAQTKAQKELSGGKPEPFKSIRPDRDFASTPGSLLIMDSLSVMLRFNEERPFLEWLETREHRAVRRDLRINFESFVRGLHSEAFYKRVEASCDGVIDVRTQEENGVLKNVLRLRVLKGQPHNNRWHEIEITPNGETELTN